MKDLHTGAAARADRPFEPRKAQSLGPALIGLVCALALALWAWQAMTEDGKDSERMPPTPRAATTMPSPDPAKPKPGQRAAPAPEPGAVVRCVRHGATTYTDQRCEPGATAQAVDIDPQRNVADALPVSPAAVIRSAGVLPPDGHFDGKAAGSAGSNKATCASLARAIELNDEAARLPQSGRSQDRLREEKRRLRDAQTASRC